MKFKLLIFLYLSLHIYSFQKDDSNSSNHPVKCIVSNISFMLSPL